MELLGLLKQPINMMSNILCIVFKSHVFMEEVGYVWQKRSLFGGAFTVKLDRENGQQHTVEVSGLFRAS